VKEKKTGKKDAARWNYSKEFKAEAAAEKREKPLSRTAVDLGVDGSLPRRWMRKAREASQGGSPPFPGHGRPRDEETARLMRENGLNARRRGKFIPAADSNRGLPVGENLLNREFQAEQAGEKRVSDIPRVPGGWIYLTAVPDLYDRRLIGRALSAGLEAVRTTIPALRMAFAKGAAREGLLFHSDRGVHYCAESFRALLQEYCPAVRRSMR
jgi:transposase InsO family protein